jgi:hypothetical protein
MEDEDVKIVRVQEARRVLTDGGIRSEIAFQNEVNLLLAVLEDICDGAPAPRPARG